LYSLSRTFCVKFLLQSLQASQIPENIQVYTISMLVGGKLQVFQEHFLSEQLTRFLNTEISAMQKSAGKPLVVLATLPGESTRWDS